MTSLYKTQKFLTRLENCLQDSKAPKVISHRGTRNRLRGREPRPIHTYIQDTERLVQIIQN